MGPAGRRSRRGNGPPNPHTGNEARRRVRLGPVGSQRTFRVVFRASSRARLHEKPADPAATWTFPMVIDGSSVVAIVRDVVDSVGGVAIHQALEVQIELDAGDLDDAMKMASSTAAMMLTLIATASRSPIERPLPLLAYETTPDATSRAFRQWTQDVPIPVGKTPAPGNLVSALQQRALDLHDPARRHCVLMAIQEYAGALREIADIQRFILLWLACEAIDRPLRGMVTRQPRDTWWGLKAVAEQRGEDPALLDDAYQLRNDLFHVRAEIDPLALPQRARDLGDQLEPLLLPSICLVLHVGSAVADGASESSSPDFVSVVLQAEIEGDPAGWGGDVHPHAEFNVSLRPGPQPKEHRTVTIQPDITFTARNVESMTPRGYEIWGPRGPNAGTWSSTPDAPEDNPTDSPVEGTG